MVNPRNSEIKTRLGASLRLVFGVFPPIPIPAAAPAGAPTLHFDDKDSKKDLRRGPKLRVFFLASIR